MALTPPDLPELERRRLADAVSDGLLMLDGALVDAQDPETVSAHQIKIAESELRGVTIDASDAPGLRISDAVFRSCSLSNVSGREGTVRRVEIHHSRLMGFALTGGTVQDLRVSDSTLALGSFAFSKLRDVIFERVDLQEASFMDTRLEGVTFVDCKLAGTDLRGAKLTGCAIRGTSLDGVIGIESLRGVEMPWDDVLASAGTLAAALGIVVES